jgi:hypothetical protein
MQLVSNRKHIVRGETTAQAPPPTEELLQARDDVRVPGPLGEAVDGVVRRGEERGL